MVKQHLKRMSAPRRWPITRKSNTFITRPNPGAHPLEFGMSLGTFFTEMLKLAKTTGEVKKILLNKDVLVDGKRRKDYRFIVGFMDVINIPELKKIYRVVIDDHSRIKVI